MGVTWVVFWKTVKGQNMKPRVGNFSHQADALAQGIGKGGQHRFIHWSQLTAEAVVAFDDLGQVLGTIAFETVPGESK